MKTGCTRCDQEGPYLPSLNGDLVALHRALHSFGRTIVAHWRRLVVVYALILLTVIVWGR